MKASKPRTEIAKIYALDYSLLVSYVEHIAYLRNICAHHGRIWNRKMTKTMQMPRTKPKHLINSFNFDEVSNRKIYNSLVMMIYLLNIISPQNHFKDRLLALIDTHAINPIMMGFPVDWKQRSIWL